MPAAAGEQLFNQFADIKALEAEKAKVISISQDVKKELQSLQAAGEKINLSGSVRQTAKATEDYQKTFAKLNDLQKAYADQQKEIIKLQKQLADGQDKENESKKNSTKLTTEEKLAKSESLKIEKERIKLAAAEEGSYTQLNLQLQKATRIYNNLSEAQRNSGRGQDLNKFISDTNTKLKQLDATQGVFRRHVGDYANSLSAGFQKVSDEIKRLKQQQQDLQNQQSTDPSGFAARGGEAQIQRTTAAINQLEKVQAIATNQNISYAQSVKQVERSYYSLANSGVQSNEFLKEFKTFAAEAKDHAQDLRDEIKALASDTRSFDLLSQSLNFVASGFQAVIGAQALVGDQSEDVQRTLTKLIAVQQVANGVREIGEQITKHGTAANKAYNVVLQNMNTLFSQSITAIQKWTSFLKLTGITAAIALIGYLISKLNLLKPAFDKNEEAVKDFEVSLEITNRTIDQQIEKIQRSIQLQIELAKQKGKNDIDISKEVAKIEQQGIEEQIEAYKKLSGEKSKALGAGVVQGAANGTLKIFKDITKSAEEQQRALGQLTNGTISLADAQGLLDNISFLKNSEAYDNYSKSYKASVDFIEKSLQSLVKVLEVTDAKEYELILAKSKRQTDQAEKNRKQYDDEKKYALELFKFQQGLIKEQNDAVANTEDFTTNSRIQAAKNAAEAEEAIILAQQKFDLSQEKITVSQRKLINQKAAQDLYKVESDLSSKIITIKKEEVEKIRQAAEDEAEAIRQADQSRFEGSQDKRSKLYEKEKLEAQKNYADDLNLAKENYDKGFTTKEQYYTRLLDLQEKYAVSSLQADVNFYESQVKILKAAGEDTFAADQALQAARQSLAEHNIQNQQKNIDTQIEMARALKEAQIQSYLDVGKAIKDSFEDVIGAIYDRQLQKIQDQIDAIDKLKDAEIDRINESSDADTLKQAKIAQAEQKAQIQREQLERRQQNIERQKAIFERAAKAFSITTDGIIEVSKIRAAASVAFASAMATIPPPANVGIATAQKAIVLSQIPGVIAGTAAALVSLLATSLPGHKKGTKSSPGGLHWIAEEGRELAIEPGGKAVMYNKKQIVDVKRGTQVFSNEVTEQIIQSNEEGKQYYFNVQPFKHEEVDYGDQTLQVLKRIEKKTGMNLNIYNEPSIETTAWWDKHMKH